MSPKKNSFEKNWEKSVVVKTSPIHGKGIFMKNSIPSNQLVLVIEGETIDGYECERREEEEDNVYIFWNGDYYIDTAMTKKIKFINHDCNPNCKVLGNDNDSLFLVSTREIKAGEEITMDYGYDEIYDECNCSSCIG